LPLGMQIIGRQGQDEQVLALADKLQKSTSWHEKVKELKL